MSVGMPRLLHYSTAPLDFDRARTYTGRGGAYKPAGLWVSVEGPDDWAWWCREEGYVDIDNRHVSEVVLVEDHRVLVLDTQEGPRA